MDIGRYFLLDIFQRKEKLGEENVEYASVSRS